jgi:hypothetical protein
MVEIPRIKFNVFSPNIFPFIIMLSLFGVIFATPYMPEVVRPYVVFVVLFAMMGGMALVQFWMQYVPRGYKHIGATIRDLNGIALKDEHFYIGPESDNLTIKHFEIKDFKELIKTKDKEGNNVYPTAELEAWFKNNITKGFKYVFRLKLVTPISVGQFKNRKEVLVCSPKSFDDTFKFMPRDKAAVWADSEIWANHPASDHVTFYLDDIPHSDYGEEVPVLLVKEAGGAWDDYHDRGKSLFDDPMYTQGMTGLLASNRILQHQYTHAEQKSEVQSSQIKGFMDKSVDIGKAVGETVEAVFAMKQTVEGAHKLIKPSSGWLGIVLLLGVVAVASVAYIGTSSPTTMAVLQAYWAAYWWLFLLIGVGALYLLWHFRRRIRRR